MLFESKKCSKCETTYDKTLDFCPNCREINEEKIGYVRQDKVSWLPVTYQLIIFFIGSFGLSIFQVIVSAIASSFTFQADIVKNAVIVFTAYFLLFIALGLILIPNYKYIFKSFKSYKPYLWGLLCGAIIIAYSILYPMFIRLFYDMKDSGNQSIAIELTRKFPVPAIIVLGFVGPICEEITYRLGLFTASKRINRVFAYILTGLIFGLIHFDFRSETIVNEFINLPIYVGTGLFFAFIYEKFGLSASITAHITNNLYSVIAILILKAMGK